MGKNSPDMRICVFCGSSLGKDPAFQEQAENLGRLFAELGIGLVYGGSDRGLMGKVSGACFEEGGEVLAIEPRGGCFINTNTPEELAAIERKIVEGGIQERESFVS